MSAPGHWVDRTPGHAPAPRGWLRDVAALAEVMFATPEGPPHRARVRWLCAELDDFTRHCGLKSAALIRSTVLATSRLAPLTVGRPGPLRRLPFERRVEALERFEASALGMAAFAVKATLCILWLEHPDTAREVGFDGQCKGSTPGG